MTKKPTKDIEVTVEVDASPDRVWQALESGDAIANWFPLNAEMEPKVGGLLKIDWGPGCGGQGRITHLKPGSRLRYEEEWPGADPDVKGDSCDRNALRGQSIE